MRCWKTRLAACLVLALALMLTSGVSCTPAGDQEPGAEPEKAADEEPKAEPEPEPEEVPQYQWRWGMTDVEESEGFQGVLVRAFREEVESWTDVDVELIVLGGEMLGPTRDQLEALQTGDIQFQLSSQGELDQFVPQMAIWALHYLWPVEQSSAVMSEVIRNGQSFKLMQEKCIEKNLLPMSHYNTGWSYWSSNKPLRGIEDLEGWKVRVMPSKMLVEAFTAYGCNPTPLPWGELYNALQLGTVEGQSNPIWYGWSASFYEVQDYFMNPWAEHLAQCPTANYEFMSSLPAPLSDRIQGLMIDLIDVADTWREQTAVTAMNLILENKPEVEFTEWTQEQTEPLRERAAATHQIYIEDGGEDAELILNTLLDDIENAKKKLGVD